MHGCSFGGESSNLRAENAPQDAHGAMHVRFHRADRLMQNLGDFRMAAAFDEPQRGGRAQMHRQLHERLFDQRDLGVAFDDRFGLGRPFVGFAQQRVGIGERVERDVGRAFARAAGCG